MTTPIVVPTIEDMAALDDDELGVLWCRLIGHVADCEANAAGARDAGNTDGADRILAARRHYLRGARTAKALLAQRKGERYEKPRPVVNFPTAIVSMKATLRMMGLLDDFHHAFTAWHAVGDAEDDDAAWNELMRCHAALSEASEVAA